MKVIKMANGPGDSRPTDANSLLEQRLADLHATVRLRQKDWAAALSATSDPQDNFAEVIRRERAARIALERQLAERQARYEIDIARAEAVRAMIDEQIREAAVEVERARHAEASAAALVTQLTLAEADAVARLAEREEQFATEFSTITATRDGLRQQLSDAESALASARHDHAQTAAEVERLEAALRDSSEQLSREQALSAEQLATYQARIEQEMATRGHVEATLASVNAAHADEERRHGSEMAAGAAVLAAREAELTAMRAEAAAIRNALERRVIAAESALSDAQEQHRTAMATAATQLAERGTQFETELTSITATRDSFERQLADVEARLIQEIESRAALDQAIAELESAAAAAEQRFSKETAAIAEGARTERARLEDQLSRERHDHEIQSASEQQQHRSEIAAAATRLAEREAHLATELTTITATRDSLEQQLHDVEARLTQESDSRTSLEQAITELRSAAAAAEQRFRDEIVTVTENARAERADLADQMSRERHGHAGQLAEEQQQHRSAMAAAATRLAEREAQFAIELASITATRDSLQARLTDVEARLTRETESRRALGQAVAAVRSAAAVDEQRFRDEIATITENAQTERTRLEEQISRLRTVAADRLAARGAEFEAELRRLSAVHATALTRFQASVAERDSRLEEQAKASAALRNQLEESEAENRRQFDDTPVPLIRCTRDVGVAGVNRAFAALVGFRSPRDLQDQFVATLFESRDDLIWLIERSMNTGKPESIETTCIRKDGVRVAVRLSARPSASALIEVSAEDLTMVRVLEDKLREAHRMEAVGRLASEVAVTCEKLLRDVYRDAQRLLTTMTGSEPPHQRAETLLEEVTRVGSFLHRLVAYGDRQAAAVAPVDVNRILRDVEPVLRQVAGDAVTLDLRKAPAPVNVDVNAERVERLLVNVASYGRERMPYGGRLRIALSTVVVDGKFIAQHPNVRQGPHALITVTEVPRPAAEGSGSDQVGEPDARFTSSRPGVDLGALQELISECGGHLWITAEPGGSMVVKMRLPLRAPWEGQAERRARHGLGRVTARLLRR